MLATLRKQSLQCKVNIMQCMCCNKPNILIIRALELLPSNHDKMLNKY